MFKSFLSYFLECNQAQSLVIYGYMSSGRCKALGRTILAQFSINKYIVMQSYIGQCVAISAQFSENKYIVM